MKRLRRLLVRVVEMSIGDGAIAPPRVGAVVDFPLSFIELGSFAPRSVRNAEVMTVRGVLELADSAPHEYHDDRTGESRWMWRGLLRGDGWTATWHGPRPLTGSVELTGHFASTLKIDPGRVRGRIARVRVISETCRTVDDTWDVVSGAASRYRDVDCAPEIHSDDHTVAEDGTYYRDTATLIDLDLDDVPPEPLRPRLIPGHISAVDDTAVWVADTELPVVARVDTHADEAVEYVLPGRAAEYRRVAATPTGCWVTGPDAVYRVTAGSGAYQAVDVGATAAVSGETLLGHHATSGWTLCTPDRLPVSLKFPDGEQLGSAGIDRSTGDFVVALRVAGQQWPQLVRITTSGDVVIGPALEKLGRCGWPFFAGSPLRAFYEGGAVATVNDDLTLGPPELLPKAPLAGGPFGDRAWIVTYRSRRDSDDVSTQWWPQLPPDDPAMPLPRAARLTILDPATLIPESGWRVDQPRSAAAQHSDAWICDRNQLYRVPLDSTRRPEPVDVSALIIESIPPATDPRPHR